MYSKMREKSRSKSKTKNSKQQTTETTKVIQTNHQGEDQSKELGVQIPVEIIDGDHSTSSFRNSDSKTRLGSKQKRNSERDRSSSKKRDKTAHNSSSSSTTNSSEIESVPIAAPRTLRSKSVGKNFRQSRTPPRKGSKITDTSYGYSVNNYGDCGKKGGKEDRNKKYEREHFSRTEVENVYAYPDEAVYEVPVIQTKPLKGILKNWNTNIHEVHGFKYPSVIPTSRFNFADDSYCQVNVDNTNALAYKPSSGIQRQYNDWKSQFAYMHPAHSTRRSRSQSRGTERRESAEITKDDWHNYSFPKKCHKTNKTAELHVKSAGYEQSSKISDEFNRGDVFEVRDCLNTPAVGLDTKLDCSELMTRSWTMPECGTLAEMNDSKSDVVTGNIGETKNNECYHQKIEKGALECKSTSENKAENEFSVIKVGQPTLVTGSSTPLDSKLTQTSKWVQTNTAASEKSVFDQTKNFVKCSESGKKHDKMGKENMAQNIVDRKVSKEVKGQKEGAIIGLDDQTSSTSSSWQSTTSSSSASDCSNSGILNQSLKTDLSVDQGFLTSGHLVLTDGENKVASASNVGKNFFDFDCDQISQTKNKQGEYEHNICGDGNGGTHGFSGLESTKHICFMSDLGGCADCGYMDKISVNHVDRDGTKSELCDEITEEKKATKDTKIVTPGANCTRHKLYTKYEEEESFEI